ncbi:morA [Symbiodinium sp. CCMP2592]|nr:morA [Symbiodinium sp. CCMP2592]
MHLKQQFQGAVQVTADETPAFLGTEATDSVPETCHIAKDAKERGSEPSQPSLRRYSVHLLEHGGAELLRTCFCPWATLRDVLYADAVCKRWHRLSREEQWMEMSILNGGVTASLRRALWRHLSAVQNIEQRYQRELGVASATEAFEALLKKPLSQAKISEIERDVHRTYPSHERFEGQEGAKGRAELQQVLQATVTAEPNVGYCQGMNFVAATLLIHLGSASDAFWMLLALLESYHYRFVFAPGVPLLPLRVFQFAGIVQRCLPRLWRHLREDGHSLEIFAHQCVLTLFSYSLEPGLLAFVYDAFFLQGWKAVFRIGASLLAFLEDQLLQMDLEDISHHLHQCKKHLRLPRRNGQLGAAAFRVLLRFDVGLGSLEELESGFQLQRLEVLLSQVSVSGEHDAQAVDGKHSIPFPREWLIPGWARSTAGSSPAGAVGKDTALDYHNQEGVGRAINEAGMREKIFVETKIPGCGMDSTMLNVFKCYENTKRDLELDLAKLNLSYVDLVIVHFPPISSMVTRSCNSWSGGCQMVRAQWKAMEEFYKQGKARAIGVSNYCPSCYDCLNSTATVLPMVNQVQLHLGMGTDPAGIVSWHKKRGIQLQAYSVLGNTAVSHKASPEILTGNLTTSIAKAHGKSSVQVALKWVVSQGIPAVTKSASAEHLSADLDLWSWDFTDEEKQALDAMSSPKGSYSFGCTSDDAKILV